jgi:E3 ubiquitin-protein ligase NEDD4
MPTPPFHQETPSKSNFFYITISISNLKMHDRLPSPVRHSNNPSILQDGDLATLLPGWSRGTTSSGRTFYIDHNSRTTSFRHPCWRDDKLDAKGPLPRGWEMRVGEGGEVYFLDHNLHRCVWEDPRDGVERGEGEGEIGVIGNKEGEVETGVGGIGKGDGEEGKGPLPRGWEVKSCRRSGNRVYFVNHNEKKTTWEDPRAVRK